MPDEGWAFELLHENLIDEGGDKAQLLTFDAFRIKLYMASENKNYSEIDQLQNELELHFHELKHPKLQKSQEVGYCFLQFCDFLIDSLELTPSNKMSGNPAAISKVFEISKHCLLSLILICAYHAF